MISTLNLSEANTLVERLNWRTLSMLNETASKIVLKEEDGDRYRKKK